MKLRKLFSAAAAAVLLCNGSGFVMPQSACAAVPVTFSGISGLPFANGDPFKGADISSVIALEQSGVKFYDRSGKEQDIFKTLAEAGVNTIRVRIWNDPTGAQNHMTYGGGANDVACAEKIAKRCADAGLKLFVDFHYSDFWADPGKQRAPKAWENYSVSQKADAIYRFTGETLKKLKATGAEIAMVQVGNETTTGMCGVSLDKGNWGDAVWKDLTSLFSAGAKAVREFDKNVLVALHFTNPEKSDNMNYIAGKLRQNNVDYDVFATSYYPYWHGTPDGLKNTLTNIAKTYGKKVLVAETSWAYNFENKDAGSNVISSQQDLGNYVSYPVGADGQLAFLEDLFRAVAAIPDGKGIGVFYWEPAWLAINADDNQRKQLWNQYGGGWATQNAMEYDADAKYYGGSSWENQALFDASGKPLESLYVFNSVHGDSVTPAVTGTVSPDASGENLLQNPDFELDKKATQNPTGWTITDPPADGHMDVRKEDAKNGEYALHWYSKSSFRFATATASVKAPVSGTYEFKASFQGNPASSIKVGLYSDSDSRFMTFSPTGWNNWFAPPITVHANAGENIDIMISVNGEGEAFGSADECVLCLQQADPVTTTQTTTTTT
ncbi:MAG: glycosyl hydrolase 53 family protein, partial [Oscillospiraceae bacterium]|nr:glycosyl hydrolase 53 family protein [Oscillospiraceae bacterium]